MTVDVLDDSKESLSRNQCLLIISGTSDCGQHTCSIGRSICHSCYPGIRLARISDSWCFRCFTA